MRIKARGYGTVLAGLMVVSTGTLSPAQAASNLAPNHSFEQAYIPPAVAHQPGVYNQPVLPVGWAFEGAAELFDHNSRNPKHGQYSVAISGSWSVVNPAGTAYVSTTPVWRTQLPIPVSPGTTYTFSTWMALSFPLDGTGAFTAIRWVDANGVPIGQSSNGAKLVTPADTDATYQTFVNNSINGYGFKDESTGWTFGTANLKAPTGAAGAVLLLGYTDSAWIGGVTFDNVCFARTTDNLCTSTYA